VELAVVFELEPRERCAIEQLEDQLLLPFEHRQKTTLDLAPKRLLLRVLFRRVRERRVVHDAVPREPLCRLRREHRLAVVRQKRSWQASFLDSLTEPVDERLCALARIPLQVATETRAIVEHSKEMDLAIRAVRPDDTATTYVKVEVPQATHVRDLEGPDLARNEGFAEHLCVPLRLRPHEALGPHVTTQGHS